MQEFPIGAGNGQPKGFLPGTLGGGMLAEAEMEFADYHVPTGITGENAFRRNSGQAIKTGLWAMQIRFGDRAVEPVQRRRRDAIEHVVEFSDSSPIGVGEGLRAAVLPRDAGFHVISRQLVAGGRFAEPRHAFAYVAPVPLAAVLFVEQDDGAVESDAGVETGRVETHQRKQGMECRDVADGMGGEHPRQPTGLIAQVAADRHVIMGDVAALTEQEIDDREDRVQPSAKLGGGRRVELHVQLAQAIPRPLDSLLDVGLGGE